MGQLVGAVPLFSPVTLGKLSHLSTPRTFASSPGARAASDALRTLGSEARRASRCHWRQSAPPRAETLRVPKVALTRRPRASSPVCCRAPEVTEAWSPQARLLAPGGQGCVRPSPALVALTGRVKEAWRAVGKQRTAWRGVQAKPQCCLDFFFFTFLSSNGDGVYRLVPFFNFCSLDRFMIPPPPTCLSLFSTPVSHPLPLGAGEDRCGGRPGRAE